MFTWSARQDLGPSSTELNAATTALRFMRVYELASKSVNLPDLDLPVSPYRASSFSPPFNAIVRMAVTCPASCDCSRGASFLARPLVRGLWPVQFYRNGYRPIASVWQRCRLSERPEWDRLAMEPVASGECRYVSSSPHQ